MSSISRFFSPRKQKHCGKSVVKRAETGLPEKEVEEWEKPVGLTAEWAIEISDSEEGPGNDGRGERIGSKETEVDCFGAPNTKKCINDLKNQDVVSEKKLRSKSSTLSARSSLVVSNSDSDCRNTAENCQQAPTPLSACNHKDNLQDDSVIDNTDSVEEIPELRGNAGGKINEERENPFASFAYDLGAESMYFGTTGMIGRFARGNKGTDISDGHSCISKMSQQRSIAKASSSLSEGQQKPYQSVHSRAEAMQKPEKTQNRRKRKTCSSSEYVPIAELKEEEKMKIRTKWQRLADPASDLEARRFQVLVAARLHAQSREPIVRAAMDALRKYFSSSPEGRSNDVAKGLCVESLSEADPEKIAPLISSVLFANVKARHIVQAANEVKTRFGGKVPESSHSLKQITGIGPVLADVLSYCNSRASYD